MDYVITHTAPRKFIDNLSVHSQGGDSCPVVGFLDELSCKIEYKNWYFGHFHIDKKISKSITCLYERIKKIE